MKKLEKLGWHVFVSAALERLKLLRSRSAALRRGPDGDELTDTNTNVNWRG